MTAPLTITPELQSFVRTIRHDLHRHPEIGTNLPRTQAQVLKALADLDGLEISTGERQSSIIAILRAPNSGPQTPVILLRADMDGLPVEEKVDIDYISQEPGRMHACGHDVHTAGLIGAAHLLHTRRSELTVDVMFMFQPAEEAFVGAKWMLEDGLLDAADKPVTAAFGTHVFSGMLEPRVWGLRSGTVMAGCDEVRIVVQGMGGHGSVPHRTLDPVPVACEIGMGLNTVVARKFGPFEPVVATLGSLQAGNDSVIIPESAEMRISLRSFSPDVKVRLLEAVQQLARSTAEAYGLSAEIEVMPDYPVTVNNPAETGYAEQVIETVFGADRFEKMTEPLSGSEDFSHVLAEVPGTFALIGAEPEGDATETNHSPRASFADSSIDDVAEFLANAAWLRNR